MDRRARVAVASLADIQPIADWMRPDDVREIQASHGYAPEEALRSSWLASKHAFTVHGDEGPIAMFGVTDLGNGVGSPWLLATSALTRFHSGQFLRGSRKFMAHMQSEFTSLENWVDARNLTSIRWLRWLGFTIDPSTPYGTAGLPFHRFTWKKG